MSEPTVWTASYTRLKSLHSASKRLKDALDKQKVNPDKIDSLVREVMAAANGVAISTSFVKSVRGKRIVVPRRQFHNLPGQIDGLLTRWERERGQIHESAETAAVLSHMAKSAGQAVYALVRDALSSLGLDEFRLR